MIRRMKGLDESTIEALKILEAQFHQRTWASDACWEMLLQQYRICMTILPVREKLQKLAQKYRDNPVRFCERVMGKKWFNPPKEIPSKLAEATLRTGPQLIAAFTNPDNMTEADARMFLGAMRTFAARTPGRKRSEVYAKALELRQTNPRMSFHQICLRLVPTYPQMSSAERRVKRDQMRSGVSRLLKAMASVQRPTKSHR